MLVKVVLPEACGAWAGVAHITDKKVEPEPGNEKINWVMIRVVSI